MMWLIASDVSGDEVRTARKVPVMSRAEWFCPVSKNGQAYRQAGTVCAESECSRSTPWPCTMNRCFTKQAVHTAVRQYSQPNAQHIIAEYLRKFATEHVSADFLRRTHFRASEWAPKFNLRFVLLPDSATSKLYFECCIFHEVRPGSKKRVDIKCVKYRTPLSITRNVDLQSA